jgi:hypothetical protein
MRGRGVWPKASIKALDGYDWAYAWYVVAVLDIYDREVADLRSNAFPVNRETPQADRPGWFETIRSRFGPK